jgi:uncharacterized protein (DUF1015 family)
MAQIAPFPGIHYDPAKVALADVIAPPYDVLSPAQQDALYARDPHNIVRLMLNKEESTDAETDNRYTRAAAFLQECLQSGVMVRDDAPALYEYLQRFAHPLDPQQIITRRTLFVALKLEPYSNGVVLPHEETHSKAKADRLNLMRATQSNPEPIYGLYEDPDHVLAARLDAAQRDMQPLLHAALPGPLAPDSERHTLYRHTDPGLLADVAAFFAPRRVWIADGHHRYETGLNYQRERREQAGLPPHPASDADLKPYDFLLIGLSAFEDPGLVVLPTYRLVKNISAARLEDLPLQLERFFHLRVTSIAEARAWIKQETPGEKRFAILLADRAYALTLRSDALADAAHDDGHCEAWRHLDVTILQTFVLDRSLGIGWQALAHTPDVAYTRDEEEAVEKVRSGECQLACLLQNPAVTEVRDVASAGDKMPQKSTFFYPKLWSGLVLRTLNEM